MCVFCVKSSTVCLFPILFVFFVFFFKQKTAYEMRISDWSSDVCSSDLFILPFRPRRLAHAYQSIWTAGGSPLLAISRAQQAGLQTRLGDEVPVALGMRYGSPSITGAIDELLDRGARRIAVLPLYPQYSATTTATVFEAVVDHVRSMRWLPELLFVNGYHDHDAYIAALAASASGTADGRARGCPF